MPPLSHYHWLCALVFIFSNVPQVHSYAGLLVVTVERIVALSDFDRTCVPIIGCIGSAADFYAVLNIDGREESTQDSYVSDSDDISPNWAFQKIVDLSKASFVVSIQVFDKDGFLRGDDDLAHISPDGADTLTLTVGPISQSAPSDCVISGGKSGSCGDHLVTRGSTGGDNAELHLIVEIQDVNNVNSLDWDIVPNNGFDLNHLLQTPVWHWQFSHQSGQLAPNFDDCSGTEACTAQFPVSDTPENLAVWPGVCHNNLFLHLMATSTGRLSLILGQYSGMNTQIPRSETTTITSSSGLPLSMALGLEPREMIWTTSSLSSKRANPSTTLAPFHSGRASATRWTTKMTIQMESMETTLSLLACLV